MIRLNVQNNLNVINSKFCAFLVEKLPKLHRIFIRQKLLLELLPVSCI